MDIQNKDDPQLKALNILINGIKVAQKRGAYELQEAEVLWNAVKVFMVEDGVNPLENTNNVEKI